MTIPNLQIAVFLNSHPWSWLAFGLQPAMTMGDLEYDFFANDENDTISKKTSNVHKYTLN